MANAMVAGGTDLKNERYAHFKKLFSELQIELDVLNREGDILAKKFHEIIDKEKLTELSKHLNSLSHD